MIDLDDPAHLALDRSGMFQHIATLGRELQAAWDEAATAGPPVAPGEVDLILISGVGGSAVAGAYFATLATTTSVIPVVVWRDAHLPAFVGPRTLVVIVSYSGNTAEALTCYAEALRHGSPVLAVTSGGILQQQALHDGTPLIHISYEGPPRAALSHGLAPLLRLGSTLGLCPVDDAAIATAAALHAHLVATTIGIHVPTHNNVAKQAAIALNNRTPVLIAPSPIAAPLMRFKTQLAENAKVFAMAEPLPEARHNFVVGLASARARAHQFALVALVPADFLSEVEPLTTLFRETGISTTTLDLPGASLLDHLIAATAFGDYISCYLALLNGVDPTPIPEVERLRAKPHSSVHDVPA